MVACVKTTPGLGPLLPVVKLKGVSFGKCANKDITVSCGKAQVSGTHIIILTPAFLNCTET